MTRLSSIAVGLAGAVLVASGCSSNDSKSFESTTSTTVVVTSTSSAPATTASPTTTVSSSSTSPTPTTSNTEPVDEPSCVPQARSGNRYIQISAFRCVGDWAIGLDANVGCSEECEGLLVLHKENGDWSVVGTCNQYNPLYPGYEMCVDPATGDSVPDSALPPPDVACELWEANTWEENLVLTGC